MSEDSLGAPKAKSELSANQAIVGLIFLLAFQIGLAALLRFTSTSYQAARPTVKLLPQDFSKLTKIDIERPKGPRYAKLLLVKGPTGWLMPEYHNFPAADFAVKAFLDSLKNLYKGIPISTTPDGPARFRLTDGDFERSITLSEADHDLFTLLLQNSPNISNSYAVLKGSNDIYNLDVNPQTIRFDPTVWMDKAFACVKIEDIVAVQTPNLTIQKKNDKWQLTGDGKDQSVSDHAVQVLLQKASQMDFHSVLGDTEIPSYDMEHPLYNFSVTLKDGKKIDFKFSKSKDKPWDVMKLSSSNFYFEVDPWPFSNVKDFTAEKILQADQSTKKGNPQAPKSKP